VPEPKPKATEQSGLARSAFETQYRDLHRFLLRRLSSPSDAADLMQDVFLRLLRIRRVDLVRQPRAYVYGIAAHVLHEFRVRAQNQRVKFDSRLLEQLEQDPSNESSTEDLADRLARLTELETALARLSPTHQAVLLLQKRDGMSREEVARALGLSVHTVKKYVFQAMAQLRASWPD